MNRDPRMAACAVLIALGANLGGCIGQYGFPQRHPTATPAAPAPAAGGDGPLAVKLQVPHRQDEFFVSRLRALTGRPVVAASAPPPSGRFVSVTVTEVPNSIAVQIWGMVAAITAFIIPVYSTASGYDLAFETFVDGRPTGSYRYAVRERIFVWVVLLPAVWVNALTRSRSDAFSDAISHFIADSAQDGFH